MQDRALHTTDVSYLEAAIKARDLIFALYRQYLSKSDKQKYNGWKNYETFAIYTWLTNEESTYNTVKQLKTVEDFKQWLEESLTTETANLKNDLITFAIDNADLEAIFEAIKNE